MTLNQTYSVSSNYHYHPINQTTSNKPRTLKKYIDNDACRMSPKPPRRPTTSRDTFLGAASDKRLVPAAFAGVKIEATAFGLGT